MCRSQLRKIQVLNRVTEMHRSYRPMNPAQSRILQKKWDQAYYEEHRRRLAAVRPQIDTRPPQTYMHLHLKLKKLQSRKPASFRNIVDGTSRFYTMKTASLEMSETKKKWLDMNNNLKKIEEERLAVIERDNRILLEKMSSIMRTTGKDYSQNSYDRKSLNRQRRLRELLRIAKENQDILKRITTSKPKYDHQQWEREWQHNLEIMDQISAYPHDWWKQNPEKSGSESSEARGREKTGSSRREKSNLSQREKSNASTGSSSERGGTNKTKGDTKTTDEKTEQENSEKKLAEESQD